jgi:hypothetical protein
MRSLARRGLVECRVTNEDNLDSGDDDMVGILQVRATIAGLRWLQEHRRELPMTGNWWFLHPFPETCPNGHQLVPELPLLMSVDCRDHSSHRVVVCGQCHAPTATPQATARCKIK